MTEFHVPDVTGKVQTVRGPIDPESLGVTLPHEHVLMQLDDWFKEPTSDEERRLAESDITLETLNYIRSAPFKNRSNLRLEDEDVALRELSAFRAAGGASIVELSLVGIGRDLPRLTALSVESKVNIIAGCGYYVEGTRPPEVAVMSEEALASNMVAELLGRVPENVGIPAGVIGELGMSSPLTEMDRKVLRCAAKAHLSTGAPLSVHALPPKHSGLEALRVLEAEGVPANRVAICHLDIELDLGFDREIAKRGAYVEYDTFGYEATGEDELGVGRPPPPSDLQRVEAIRALIAEGYSGQVLVSHDICLKTHLHSFGGYGYDHLLRHVPKFFSYLGIDEDVLVGRLLAENPANWLTWTPVEPATDVERASVVSMTEDDSAASPTRPRGL